MTIPVSNDTVLSFECLIQVPYGLLIKLIAVNEEQNSLGYTCLQDRGGRLRLLRWSCRFPLPFPGGILNIPPWRIPARR